MTSVQVAEVLMELDGEGSPVVMVHGLGGTSNTFQPLLAALAGFRVVRPDFPGSGRSPPPPQPITLALLLIESALSHLGVGRAHLVGHSFGAFIAQHFGWCRDWRVRPKMTTHWRWRSCAKAICGKTPRASPSHAKRWHRRERRTMALSAVRRSSSQATRMPSRRRVLRRNSPTRRAKTVALHRCGHWTPIEKVKECGTLLSEILRGIPI